MSSCVLLLTDSWSFIIQLDSIAEEDGGAEQESSSSGSSPAGSDPPSQGYAYVTSTDEMK
jgi:hypothetical protein